MAKFSTIDEENNKKHTKKTESREKDDLVSKIMDWKENSEEKTARWSEKQKYFHNLRMRVKKEKSEPFANSCNLRMPTLEVKIRKVKAALCNVLTGVRPVVQAVPTPSGNRETALKVEKFLDHLLMDIIKVKNKLIIGIDQMLEKGFFLFKPFWNVEITNRTEVVTIDDMDLEEAKFLFDPVRKENEALDAIMNRLSIDQSPIVRADNIKEVLRCMEEFARGATEVKLKVQDVIKKYPDFALCSPERVYVPSNSGYDPQDCQWIIHEFFMPLRTLKQRAEQIGWNKTSVDNIESCRDLDTQKLTDIEKDKREGIESLNNVNELVRIWECYCWYDINDDGELEKCVVTIAPDFGEELRKIQLPFYSNKFPFVKIFYELIDDRWFSHRGIPEIVEDIVKEIDVQHMQKIDSQTLRNSPLYLHRASIVNPKTVQFKFGQSIPVNGFTPLNDVMKPLNNSNTNVEYSYKDEQMLLEGKIEEVIGQIDYAMQSQINRRQPRTAQEVFGQQQQQQMVFSLDANMLTEQVSDLFCWLYDLYCQYGDDEYEFMYFGDKSPNGEKIRLNREEIQGKYKIKVRGNEQNTNPQIRLQKAQTILEAQLNQIAISTGVVTPQNIAEGYKRFYQEMQIDNSDSLFTIPPPPTPPQPQIPLTIEKIKLTDDEEAQILIKYGIKPDGYGRSEKEANRRLEFATEKDMELLKNQISAEGQEGVVE